MSLSLNGIKSTGMHLEVQRPAKWRRDGCDRERTETSGVLLGERVSRIWVDVTAQHVRRHVPLCCLGYLQYPFGGNAIALPLAYGLTRNAKGVCSCSIGREVVENFHA